MLSSFLLSLNTKTVGGFGIVGVVIAAWTSPVPDAVSTYATWYKVGLTVLALAAYYGRPHTIPAAKP